MKPRLRAEELTGMISLLRDKFVRSENLRRCCFVPMRRNSVFDGLRSNLFKFIQERISLKVVVSVSRDRAEFVGVKEMYSWVSYSTSTSLEILSNTFSYILSWMNSDKLLLNPSTTEFLLVGTNQQRLKFFQLQTSSLN